MKDCIYEWYYDIRRQAYCYINGVDPDELMSGNIEPHIIMPRYIYDDLKKWMVENDPHGVIRTDRKEDLKIIHRLFDIIEKRKIS